MSSTIDTTNNGRKLRSATERKGLTGSVVGLPFNSVARPFQEAQQVAQPFQSRISRRRLMTREEAVALKGFKNYCTCGGYAWQTNGRPESQPHMDWCPQAAEYAEWWAALHSADSSNSGEP